MSATIRPYVDGDFEHRVPPARIRRLFVTGDTVLVVAEADLPVQGSVTGSYVNTQASDAAVQEVFERESGGKPANRYSYLEHRWRASVPAGTAITFHVRAHHTASPDGDDFVLSGVKRHVPYASSADRLVVLARTGPDDGGAAGRKDRILLPRKEAAAVGSARLSVLRREQGCDHRDTEQRCKRYACTPTRVRTRPPFESHLSL